MKKLIGHALLVALLCVPAIARAGITAAPAAAIATAGTRQVDPAPAADSSGSASDYAAREKAAPQLGQFEGGHAEVYIGGGLLTVVIIVVLVVLIV